MVPQLYMNYKLKSVAAMPWRQMSYKFLNTIIDDLYTHTRTHHTATAPACPTPLHC